MVSEIGEYRLLEKLGEGAAGEVYLASPMKHKPFAQPGELVAVKVYKEEILKQPGQAERMEREFEVGSQITHPNIVRILEFSPQDKGKRPYLVMEYVDGMTLAECGALYYPLSDKMLIVMAEQLAAGLKALHDAGIIHRDVKPQNIMVSSTFRVKVMDLGVIEVKSDKNLTPPDKFLGTIRNSSPELLHGESHDHRTDIYSLGTVIYFLLHGEELFSEEMQFARLISLVREQDPEFDPSLTTQGDVRSKVADLCKRLLSKDQSQRPASCTLVFDELATLRGGLSALSQEPVHAYIATALTGLDQDAKDSIDFAASKIAEVCKAYEIYVYQPRKVTDPIMHKDVEASAVYGLDRKRVVGADLLFVLANKASFGVGQEIEIAGALGKPTLLVSREGVKISRMVTGGFANIVDEISYRTPEDLERKLRKSIAKHLEKFRRLKACEQRRHPMQIAEKLMVSRKAMGLGLDEAAEKIGISVHLLSAVENHSIQYHNVGLQTLGRICEAYGLSLIEVLDKVAIPQQRVSAREDPNVRRLEVVGRKLGWNLRDFVALREEYFREVAASGSPPTIDSNDWVARHSALEKRRLENRSEERELDPDNPRNPMLPF